MQKLVAPRGVPAVLQSISKQRCRASISYQSVGLKRNDATIDIKWIASWWTGFVRVYERTGGYSSYFRKRWEGSDRSLMRTANFSSIQKVAPFVSSSAAIAPYQLSNGYIC